MNKIFFFLFLLTFAVSCSSIEGDKDFKRLELSEYYMDSGSHRYFLPAIPDWLNYSEGAQCQREKRLSYLDFDALKKGQALSYEQILHLQAHFNLTREEKIETLHLKTLSPKDEEGVFFEALQKVQAGFQTFVRPKFERIHLVWVDPFLSDAKNLKKEMQKDMMNKGQPVFVSQCLGKKSLELWLEKNGLYDARLPSLTMEYFSVFDSSSKRQMQFLLDFDKLFESKQKLHLFLFGNAKPKEFVGSFEIHP